MNTFTKTLAYNTESTGIKWGKGSGIHSPEGVHRREGATCTRTSTQSPEEGGTFAREGVAFVHQGAFATHSPEEGATLAREEVAFVHQGAFRSPGGVCYKITKEGATLAREEVAFVHQGAFHSPGGVSFTRGRFIHQGAFHSPNFRS